MSKTGPKIQSLQEANLNFMQAPELAAGTLTIGSVFLRVMVQGFLVAATQSPALIKQFLPLGSPASQVEQIGDLNTMLGRLSIDLKNAFDRLLKSLMSDVSQFVLFASTGAWSGQVVSDYASTITSFDWMLKTHISSQALKMNNYWGQAVGVVDQEWWDTAGRSGNILHKHIPDMNYWLKDSPTPEGQVNKNWFRSNATGRIYGLNYKKGGAPKNGKGGADVLQLLISYSWAQLEVLFDGALNCTYLGLAGKDQVIGVNVDGSLNVGCVSSLPIYFACGCGWGGLVNCCPAIQPDGKCPYFGHVGPCQWYGLGETGVEWMWRD